VTNNPRLVQRPTAGPLHLRHGKQYLSALLHAKLRQPKTTKRHACSRTRPRTRETQFSWSPSTQHNRAHRTGDHLHTTFAGDNCRPCSQPGTITLMDPFGSCIANSLVIVLCASSKTRIQNFTCGRSSFRAHHFQAKGRSTSRRYHTGTHFCMSISCAIRLFATGFSAPEPSKRTLFCLISFLCMCALLLPLTMGRNPYY